MTLSERPSYFQRLLPTTELSLTSIETSGAVDSSSLSFNGDRPKDDDVKAKYLLPSPRTASVDVQSLTINKLKYDDVGFVGRDTESEILKSCFERMLTSNDETEDRQIVEKELVFISGPAGVGKTKLANSLKKQVTSTQTGIFAEGKFDSNRNDEPYAGIAEAFGHICRTVGGKRLVEQGAKPQSDETGDSDDGEIEFPAISRELSTELGSAAPLLVNLIPELQDILPPAGQGCTPESLDKSFSESSINSELDVHAQLARWKFAFRVLTRILSSYVSPMVLVLDDLHWADLSSLEVIEMLISDTENTNPLMVIGSFRSNEVDDTNFLSIKMKDLASKKDKFGFNIENIEVENFNVSDATKVITTMLSTDKSADTEALAEICFKRTLGNPFFLIQFVTMLEEQGLISFNFGLLKWVWDLERVKNQTVSTLNVVELLRARMSKLSNDSQLLLKYAACLGSSFSRSILDRVWVEADLGSPKDTQELSVILSELVDGNYFEPCENATYRWVHDKVQEAAFSLGNVGDTFFQFQVGSTLLQCLDGKELDDSLFVVTDLINKGKVKQKIEYARLNLRAADKARRLSAFQSAAMYISNGIDALPSDAWSSNRATTLRLYSMGAEMELAFGRADIMEKYSQEVLSQGNLSTMEKLPVYVFKFQKLCNVDQEYDSTLNLVLNVLKELGSPIPKGPTLPVRAISSLLKTIKAANKTPKSFLERPHVMTDRKQKAIMLFLVRLYSAAYHVPNNFLFLISVCRIVQMTLEHGISDVSGQGFAALGLMANAVLGDLETGSRLAEMGLLLQQSISSNSTKSTTYFLAHFGPLGWTKPLHDCAARFHKGYKAGVRSGNTEDAVWNLHNHRSILPFIMGKPLPRTAENCSNAIRHMEDMNQVDKALYSKFWHQMYLNLMGESEHPLRMNGKAFDRDAFVEKSPLQSVALRFHERALLVLFGEFQAAADLAIEHEGEFEKFLPGQYTIFVEAFHRGVALYAVSRRTRKWKYIRAARRVRKKIERLAEKGNPNVRHYMLFLSAEQASLDNDYRKAEDCYKEAIILAGRAGILHEAALFNERYADFLRQKGPYFEGLEDEEKYRMEQALHYYKEWGAKAKVEQLEKRMRHL